MIADFPEQLPEDALDVTDDVNELKNQLQELFFGKEAAVVAMAIGSLIGETFANSEAIKDILTAICNMAGTSFALNNHPEQGARIH